MANELELPEELANAAMQIGDDAIYNSWHAGADIRALLRRAIAMERERCAQIAESFDACDTKHIAAAIRGQTPATVEKR